MRQLIAGAQPGRACSRLGRSPVAAAGVEQWSPRWQAKQSHSRLAAAAEASAYTADALVSQAIPYCSRSVPKLQSRSMTGSPADGLWSAITGTLLRLELFSAATVDKHTAIGPTVMSVLAGASVAMGLDGLTLLQHGLPPYFQDILFSVLAVWDTTLWTVALAAVALPATAWALKDWWVSSLVLLSAPGGAVQQLQHLVARQQQHQQQQPQQQQDITSEQQVQQQPVASSSSWLAALLAVVRGVTLTSAVSSISGALACSSVTGRVIIGAAAVIATAVAAAPVALLLVRKQQTSAAASLLAVEAAYVLALIGLSPSVNAVAAAVIAASLWSLHQQLLVPRLLAYKASEGDQVEVHVSLRVAGTEAVFDSTYTADPVKLVAAKADPEFKQAWAELSANKLWDQDAGDGADMWRPRQQQEGTDHRTAGDRGGTSSSSSTDTVQPSEQASTSDSKPYDDLRTVIQTQQSWMTNPEARWEALQPFAAEAVCGMVLGETRSVRFFNPKGVGYWNPNFSWWQPLTDVDEKFKGQPDPGDVFWYPVSDEAYLQTRVTTVGDTLVELDANYGVTGTDLRMDVQLVRLNK